MKSMYYTFSQDELENKIRELAMREMLTPSYTDGVHDKKYYKAIPYYNDAIRTFADVLISELIPDAEANNADS